MVTVDMTKLGVVLASLGATVGDVVSSSSGHCSGSNKHKISTASVAGEAAPVEDDPLPSSTGESCASIDGLVDGSFRGTGALVSEAKFGATGDELSCCWSSGGHASGIRSQRNSRLKTGSPSQTCLVRFFPSQLVLSTPPFAFIA